MGEFPLTENLVSFGLTVMGELRIGGATVDKEWCFRFIEVRLLKLCEELEFEAIAITHLEIFRHL